jgi:hypothetical protein
LFTDRCQRQAESIHLLGFNGETYLGNLEDESFIQNIFDFCIKQKFFNESKYG